jgi:hypothetical protein
MAYVSVRSRIAISALWYSSAVGFRAIYWYSAFRNCASFLFEVGSARGMGRSIGRCRAKLKNYTVLNDIAKIRFPRG